MARVTKADFLATYIPRDGELGTEEVFQRSLEQLKKESDWEYETFKILTGNDAFNTWDNVTIYEFEDYVLWNGINYIATGANSNSEPQPDNSNANWEVVTFTVSGTGGANITRQDYVTTAGQTIFMSTQTLGQVGVFVEGVLIDESEFTVVNNTYVQFNEAFVEGINVSIFSNAPALDTSMTAKHVETATAGQTVFTTTFDMAKEAVYINGVLQDSTTYAVTPTTITFNEGLLAGDLVTIFANVPVETTILGPIETDFDVTLGQTSFTVTYDPNNVQVFLNGIKLRSTEFSATNGASISIPSAVENDWVQVINYVMKPL